MNNTVAHQKLVDDILYAVGSLPHIRVWTRTVGLGSTIGDKPHAIRFGIAGEADIDGIVAPTGRKLQIECKTGGGVLSARQKKWKKMIEKFGGIYIQARSVEQVLTDLKTYR